MDKYPELVHSMWRKIDIVIGNLVCSPQKAKNLKNQLKTLWKHRSDHQKGKDMLGM